MKTVIEAKNLSVRYGKNEALKDISFVIEAGDFIGLAGPNGAGKTTLIKAIFGLVPVSSGEIKLFGEPLPEFGAWEKFGYLPQKLSTLNPLFPATAEEVVLLGLLAPKKTMKRINRSDTKRAREILGKLGISDLKKRMLSELSGGQQQRVLLARSLASRPAVLVFDEPSTALDPESREYFYELIQKLNKKEGVTVILITHDTSYIGKYATKLMYLDKKMIYYGTFDDFCKSDRMGAYFGEHGQHVICHQHEHLHGYEPELHGNHKHKHEHD